MKQSTISLSDSGANTAMIQDFLAVDKVTHKGATSRILREVAWKSVWDHVKKRPERSDHLPVEGELPI